MSDVEYVARVIIERVERRVMPKGTAVNPRRTTTEDRIIRDKAEVASFTIRSTTLASVAQRVGGVLAAALPDQDVKGEPDLDDEEEEDEEP
jgi:hypothetical protein